MKQRKQAEDSFLVGKLQDLVNAVQLGQNISVGERNTFWRAGSAACIDQQGCVVRVNIRALIGDVRAGLGFFPRFKRFKSVARGLEAPDSRGDPSSYTFLDLLKLFYKFG